MNGNNDTETSPSSPPLNQDALDFLALLCDELGDKEAIGRAYQRWQKGERLERGYGTLRPKEYEGRSFASEMYRMEMIRREGLPPYDDEREKELEANFDPARQVKVTDEHGNVRILNKSWAWAVTEKAREEEAKRPWLKENSC
jgi:hypothetical protein